MLASARRPETRRFAISQSRWEAIAGYLFISPWLIGFFIFTFGPMVVSAGLSLLKTDLLTPAVFIGTDNFANLLEDELFWKSLGNTAVYVVGTVALGMLGSLTLHSS